MSSATVVIRIDDVDQLNFFEISDWFVSNHPEVPVCCFLWKTDNRWNRNGWKKVKEMIKKYNWEIGGHTRSHPFLTLLTTDEIEREVKKNIEDIEMGLKSVGLEYKVKSFAYPYGDFNGRVKQVLKSLNVPLGLTYPDAFPYKSLLNEIDPLEVGITSIGKLPLPVLNNRFVEVYKNDGIYCLCLHTNLWRYSLTKKFKYFKKSRKSLIDFLRIFYRLFKSENRWKVLDRHLSYIKKINNIKFLTFRDLSISRVTNVSANKIVAVNPTKIGDQ